MSNNSLIHDHYYKYKSLRKKTKKKSGRRTRRKQPPVVEHDGEDGDIESSLSENSDSDCELDVADFHVPIEGTFLKLSYILISIHIFVLFKFPTSRF